MERVRTLMLLGAVMMLAISSAAVLFDTGPSAAQGDATVTYRDDGCTNYEALPPDTSGYLPNAVSTFADSCLERDGQQLTSVDVELTGPLSIEGPIVVDDDCTLDDIGSSIQFVVVPELGFSIVSYVSVSYRKAEGCGELSVIPRHQPDWFDGLTRRDGIETLTFHHEGCGATVDWEVGPEGGPADNANRFIIETEHHDDTCVITNFERRRQLLSVTYPDGPAPATPLPSTPPGEDNPLGPIVIVDEDDPLGPVQSSSFDELAARPDLTGHHANIFRLYWAAFDREPDVGGAEFWVDAFNSGAWPTLTRIAEHFVVSAEFIETYGQMTDAGFVEALYLNVLDRPSDETGRAFWLDSLDDGTRSRGQVLADFSFSAEFRAAHPLPSDDR